jgi:hypothetical protein
MTGAQRLCYNAEAESQDQGKPETGRFLLGTEDSAQQVWDDGVLAIGLRRMKRGKRRWGFSRVCTYSH